MFHVYIYIPQLEELQHDATQPSLYYGLYIQHEYEYENGWISSGGKQSGSTIRRVLEKKKRFVNIRGNYQKQ